MTMWRRDSNFSSVSKLTAQLCQRRPRLLRQTEPGAARLVAESVEDRLQRRPVRHGECLPGGDRDVGRYPGAFPVGAGDRVDGATGRDPQLEVRVELVDIDRVRLPRRRLADDLRA